jgi:pantoate--beta-alanine ligase
MVADLNMPVEIVGRPTVREPDGLAMSSRNAYLAPADRARATAIFRGISAARDRAAAGERSVAALLAEARALVEKGVDRIDYLEIRDAQDLTPIGQIAGPAVILVAALVGATRLIDNLRLV